MYKINNKKALKRRYKFNTEDFIVDYMRKIRIPLVYNHTQRINEQKIR